MDWSKYPNFTEEEFKCHETGQCKMHSEFMDRLQLIRNSFRKPMIISSGYRAPTHTLETNKPFPGEHTYGLAADISIGGIDAMDLVKIAVLYGVVRIGVSQHGDYSRRFIHLGLGNKFFVRFPPAIWSY